MSCIRYKFNIDREKELEIDIPCGVFIPTGTSGVLFNAVKNYIAKPGKILDLGCGSGLIGLSLFKVGKADKPLYASDISKKATENVKQNAAIHNCPVVARVGSIFEPWEGEKFDYIINDVSGVARDAAKLSGWFKDIPCDSGSDGTDLVIEVIKKAAGYLNPRGRLFFPIISFSNKAKILKTANMNFTNVVCLARQEWPLPKEMYEHRAALINLKKDSCAEFIEKFGMIIWFTEVYAAHNS